MRSNAASIIEIESSPRKLLILCGLGVLMTALSAAVAIPLYPDFRPSAYQQAMSYIGVAFFALCTLVIGWRLVTARGPVITITPDGIRDTRVAAGFIPWRAVRSIKTWQYSRQKIMVLSIDPAVERQLQLTAMTRWSRGANRALGADGLCITPAGLKIEYSDLLAISEDRVRAAHSRASSGRVG